MRILNISKREKEVIESGNLVLLKQKIEELEAIWSDKLILGTSDHRYTQGVYVVIADVKELLS